MSAFFVYYDTIESVVEVFRVSTVCTIDLDQLGRELLAMSAEAV